MLQCRDRPYLTKKAAKLFDGSLLGQSCLWYSHYTDWPYRLRSRRHAAVVFKGVILTGPGSVWFGLVRNRSDFDSFGSVNRKRVYGSVCDQSEPSS